MAGVLVHAVGHLVADEAILGGQKFGEFGVNDFWEVQVFVVWIDSYSFDRGVVEDMLIESQILKVKFPSLCELLHWDKGAR